MTAARRIALVGTAASGRHAPFDDPSWEIWGVSARAAYVTRATRWFELHRLDGEPEQWARDWRDSIRKWSQDVELVMLYPEPDLGPRVTTYPHERITSRFGTYFMTSTFSWMMALAIDEMKPADLPVTTAYDTCEIGLWGVDMEFGTEYREQRVGLRHFIDLARVLGITVRRLASGGMAYEPVPYPLIQDDPLLAKLALRSAGTGSEIATCSDSKRTTELMIATCRGARDEIAQAAVEGYDPTRRLAELARQIGMLEQTAEHLSADIARLDGARAEQAWLADFLRP